MAGLVLACLTVAICGGVLLLAVFLLVHFIHHWLHFNPGIRTGRER